MSDEDTTRIGTDDPADLGDYDALSDEQLADPADDPDRIDITQSDGPNLEEGDDLDTGAAVQPE
jgi:hypothetical protein